MADTPILPLKTVCGSPLRAFWGVLGACAHGRLCGARGLVRPGVMWVVIIVCAAMRRGAWLPDTGRSGSACSGGIVPPTAFEFVNLRLEPSDFLGLLGNSVKELIN